MVCGASNAELNIHEIYRSFRVTLNAGESYRQGMLRYAGGSVGDEAAAACLGGGVSIACGGVLEVVVVVVVAARLL